MDLKLFLCSFNRSFARWLADQLDAPLLAKRASDLMSMWSGETEKNLAWAFKQAETERAILLIDEADSFLHDRRGARTSWEILPWSPSGIGS